MSDYTKRMTDGDLAQDLIPVLEAHEDSDEGQTYEIVVIKGRTLTVQIEDRDGETRRFNLTITEVN